MESVEQLLSSEEGIQAYVDTEVTRALRTVPAIWELRDSGVVERHVGREGVWSWATDESRKLSWRVSCGGIGNTDLYYEVIASRDLEVFLLTHSNHNAGFYDTRWLIRTAMIIPFKALYAKPSIFRAEALSLGQMLSEVCLEHPPNCDWPT
jgi:hypothetical protein